MAFAEQEKIASISIDPREALGVNTKEQLELLENLG
jgi:bifunctional N-acetylglucosamine-1-phosphate-uridyltransferase/glucosamine-1-phosphate-acetyltransferase GlmU-like protein